MTITYTRICGGCYEMRVNGQRVATIYQREDRKFWYTDPSIACRSLLDDYAPTLKELKGILEERLNETQDFVRRYLL